MALDSARGIMNCGTGGRIEKAGTDETSGTGREFLNMNFELGTSCKLAPAGGNVSS